MSHFERIIILTVVVGVLLGGFFLVRSPRVRELFQSPPAEAAPSSLPPAPPVSPDRPPRQRQATAAPSRGSAPPPQPHNQVPNREVTRVLLQILAARGLSSGIGLTVTDDRIEVTGTVKSQADREAILQVLDKGRESRRIVADQLVVGGEGSEPRAPSEAQLGSGE